jgi:DNA-binding MarR family transcriptional regulator
MSHQSFFKPTQLYHEYMILDLIEKNKNITQREMALSIGLSVSMVNSHLDNYEKEGLIKRKKHSTKNVEYFVTKEGIERKKLLNIGYLKDSQTLYDNARENIEKFLVQLKNKGKFKLFLYGAGEVAELLLHTIYSSEFKDLTILGVIDDDKSKVGSLIYETPVVSLEVVNIIEHNGILISSYTNKKTIVNNLIKFKYDSNKIYHFFDI